MSRVWQDSPHLCLGVERCAECVRRDPDGDEWLLLQDAIADEADSRLDGVA